MEKMFLFVLIKKEMKKCFFLFEVEGIRECMVVFFIGCLMDMMFMEINNVMIVFL